MYVQHIYTMYFAVRYGISFRIVFYSCIRTVTRALLFLSFSSFYTYSFIAISLFGGRDCCVEGYILVVMLYIMYINSI